MAQEPQLLEIAAAYTLPAKNAGNINAEARTIALMSFFMVTPFMVTPKSDREWCFLQAQFKWARRVAKKN
jgi:hypothetical protein